MEESINQLLKNPSFLWVAVLAAAWSLPWKGVALWKAAQVKSKPWFIVLLVVNSLAILEILYIFVFSKKAQKNTNTESN